MHIKRAPKVQVRDAPTPDLSSASHCLSTLRAPSLGTCRLVALVEVRRHSLRLFGPPASGRCLGPMPRADSLRFPLAVRRCMMSTASSGTHRRPIARFLSRGGLLTQRMTEAGCTCTTESSHNRVLCLSRIPPSLSRVNTPSVVLPGPTQGQRRRCALLAHQWFPCRPLRRRPPTSSYHTFN